MTQISLDKKLENLNVQERLHHLFLHAAVVDIWKNEPFPSSFCEALHWHALETELHYKSEKIAVLLTLLTPDRKLTQANFWKLLDLSPETLQSWTSRMHHQDELEKTSLIITANCNIHVSVSQFVQDLNVTTILKGRLKPLIEKKELDEMTSGVLLDEPKKRL